MNRKMVYTPREIACKTVTVTEPYVCPTPTVEYPDTPDISFAGANGECRITIDVGAGNTIVGLAPNTSQSFIRVDTGSGWVYLDEYVNPMVSLQTIDAAWEMGITGDYWVHVETQIVSSCGKTSGVISSELVQYIPGVADIVATKIIVTPSTCEAPCGVSIWIEWTNVGTVVGEFNPGYTIDGTLYTEYPYTLTVSPGDSATITYMATLPDAGSYVICPVPN